MQIKVKYLVRRRNNDGSFRYYWDRPGYELVKLGKELGAAATAAESLNNEADGTKRNYIASQVGNVNWVIDEFRETDRYLELSAGTRRMYEVWLRRYGQILGDVRIADLQRSDIRELMKGIKATSSRNLATSVLSNLFEVAKDRDLITVNHALRLGHKKGDGRTEWFPREAVKAWLDAAEVHPLRDVMVTKFWLLYYTGQRVNDCLDMPGERYDGDTVLLRQQKTRHLLRVPAHQKLVEHLKSIEIVPDQPIGGEISYPQFNVAWKEICEAAGLTGKQARDLRRTAVINLAEAGCSDIEISAITGHSLASIKRILDSNYLVRTDPMARAAISKWEGRDEDHGKKVERRVRKTTPK